MDEKEAQEKLNQLDEVIKERQEKLRPGFWNYIFWIPLVQSSYWEKFPKQRRILYLISITLILISIIVLFLKYY